MDEACNCTALRKASRRISLLYDRELAPSGVTSGQFSILRQVHRRGDDAPTMTELAQALVLDRTALKHALTPLERDGLVTARPHPSDRRARCVALTTKGERVFVVAQSAWSRAQATFTESFGEDQASALRALLGLAAGMPMDPPTAEASS